ncbi:MAG: hypothetical protein AAF927_14665 [Bacteroidota bacterium]
MLRAYYPFVACLFLFFSSYSLNAQLYEDGYIVSNRGDSIFGIIKVPKTFAGQRKIHFVDLNGARVVYHPERIAAYGYGKMHFESLPIPYLYAGIGSDTIAFLQRIVSGHAQLYRYYTKRSAFTLSQGPGFVEFIRKPDETWHEISPNFRWKKLAITFKECSVLAQKIKQDEYKLGETAAVVRAYNVWYEERRLTVSRGN